MAEANTDGAYLHLCTHKSQATIASGGDSHMRKIQQKMDDQLGGLHYREFGPRLFLTGNADRFAVGGMTAHRYQYHKKI